MDHNLYSADRNGNVTLVYENPFADGVPGGTVIYRRAPRDGYGTVRLTKNLEYGYRVGVISTDGKDVSLFNITDLYEMFGYESGETWANETFYIDDDGKVLATYKDCCPFYNGYAAVIDHNGDAYVINAEFESVSEIFEAEYVSTLGEVQLFNDGTINRMVVIE